MLAILTNLVTPFGIELASKCLDIAKIFLAINVWTTNMSKFDQGDLRSINL